MLTPRRSLRRAAVMAGAPSGSARSAARPVDRVDRRRGPERRDDVGEMLHVLHLDVDEYLEEILRAVGDLEIGDVAAVLADDGGERAQAAGLVADRDGDAPDMRLVGIALRAPGDVQPALGRVGVVLQRLAIDGVDGDTLAGGHDADDAIARQRMAGAR